MCSSSSSRRGFCLEEALQSLQELNSILDSSILVADQLVNLVKALPGQYREQREFLLEVGPTQEDKSEQLLRETGIDPQWPRQPGVQARFVAESMAGAEWGPAAATSREYIRQQKPKRRSGPVSFERAGKW